MRGKGSVDTRDAGNRHRTGERRNAREKGAGTHEHGQQAQDRGMNRRGTHETRTTDTGRGNEETSAAGYVNNGQNVPGRSTAASDETGWERDATGSWDENER
jgi:hypothetical protein